MHQPSDAVTRAFAGWRANLVDLTTANPLLHFRPDRNTLQLALPAAGTLGTIRAASDAYHQALADRDSPFGGSTYDVIGELAHLADAPVMQVDHDPAVSGGLAAARVASFADALDDLCQVAPILLAPSIIPGGRSIPLPSGPTPPPATGWKSAPTRLASPSRSAAARPRSGSTSACCEGCPRRCSRG
jgi:hypothetical protein